MQIVTFLWRKPTMFHGRSYSENEVNTLFRMIRRNTSIPFEAVCITDDPEGIDHDIRVVPLWSDLKDWGKCWRRLKIYSAEMSSLIGKRFTMLDVDTVIVGSMDPLLKRTEEFIAYRCPSRAAIYSGGIVTMNAGCRSFVWDSLPSTIPDLPFDGSDQAWISEVLPSDEATHDPSNGVYFQRNYEGQGNASVVFLSGIADPRFPPWSEAEWVKRHYW